MTEQQHDILNRYEESLRTTLDVSYTTLDKATNQLITIDYYIYSPKDDKRNLLRSLEHLIYGVSFTTK